MASFEVSELAKQDLKEVHQYGVRRWGEVQADRYFNALYDHIEAMARDPLRFPLAEGTLPGCRRSVFRAHAVYFEISDGSLTILSIIRSQDIRRLTS